MVTDHTGHSEHTHLHRAHKFHKMAQLEKAQAKHHKLQLEAEHHRKRAALAEQALQIKENYVSQGVVPRYGAMVLIFLVVLAVIIYFALFG